MDLEHLSEYILPVLLLLFYLVGNWKKKRAPKPQQNPLEEDQPASEKEDRITPFSYRIPKSLPPLPQKPTPAAQRSQRSLGDFESSITSRHIPSNIEKRTYVSSISNERTDALISREMMERIDADQAYSLKFQKGISRGRALLNNPSSLKNAFILQEIFNNDWINRGLR